MHISAAFFALIMFVPVAWAGEDGPFADNPLIAIAGGPFIFGSDSGEPNEGPARDLELPAFRITKYEITNRLYRDFVAATGHRQAFYDSHPVLGLADHPVVGVAWSDADAFCRFYGLRLPSEQQWERAARGPSGRTFAWGDEKPTPDRSNRGGAVCCGPDPADGYPATAPVGSYPAGDTPQSVADMTGNVWEWTDGWFNPYDAGPAARRTEFRVARGGAWNSDDRKLRTTYRLAYDGGFRFAANAGFRCAGSP